MTGPLIRKVWCGVCSKPRQACCPALSSCLQITCAIQGICDPCIALTLLRAAMFCPSTLVVLMPTVNCTAQHEISSMLQAVGKADMDTTWSLGCSHERQLESAAADRA